MTRKNTPATQNDRTTFTKALEATSAVTKGKGNIAFGRIGNEWLAGAKTDEVLCIAKHGGINSNIVGDMYFELPLREAIGIISGQSSQLNLYLDSDKGILEARTNNQLKAGKTISAANATSMGIYGLSQSVNHIGEYGINVENLHYNSLHHENEGTGTELATLGNFKGIFNIPLVEFTRIPQAERFLTTLKDMADFGKTLFLGSDDWYACYSAFGNVPSTADSCMGYDPIYRKKCKDGSLQPLFDTAFSISSRTAIVIRQVFAEHKHIYFNQLDGDKLVFRCQGFLLIVKTSGYVKRPEQSTATFGIASKAFCTLTSQFNAMVESVARIAVSKKHKDMDVKIGFDGKTLTFNAITDKAYAKTISLPCTFEDEDVTIDSSFAIAVKLSELRTLVQSFQKTVMIGEIGQYASLTTDQNKYTLQFIDFDRNAKGKQKVLASYVGKPADIPLTQSDNKLIAEAAVQPTKSKTAYDPNTCVDVDAVMDEMAKSVRESENSVSLTCND